MRIQICVVIAFICLLSDVRCCKISREYPFELMNTSDGTIMNADITMLQRSLKRHFVLHPIMENKVFLVAYHNEIDCVINLVKYWKLENAAFITDSRAGISAEDFRAYVKERFSNVAFEVVSMDSNVDFEKMITTLSENFVNFATFCNKHNTDKIIQVVKGKNMFITNHRWIIVSHALPNVLNTTMISAETQVILISPKTASELKTTKDDISLYNVEIRLSSKFFIYDIFYSYRTTRVEFIKFAHWTEQKGLFMLENFDSPDWPLRLKGRGIKLGAFIQTPYVKITEINGTFDFTGFSSEIIQMLMDFFKVNSSLTTYEPVWGIHLQNGSFTGLLGVVHRKEIDMSMNIFLPATYRAKAARYICPLAKVDVSMSYETPPSVIPPTTYLLPFKGEVWLCITIEFAFVLLALAVAMCFSPGWKSAKLSSGSLHTNTFRLLTGTFFDEALTDPPGGTAKVIYGTLLLATLAIFIFYTSVFVSFLTYRELEMPIRSFKDLAENHEYTGVTVASTFYEGMLRFAATGFLNELWKKMEKTKAFSLQPTLEDAVQTLYRGKNVVLFDGTQTIVQANNNCSISVIRTNIVRENSCFVARHDFPYSRMVYMRLLRMKEGGLLNRLAIKYPLLDRPPCDNPEPSLTFGMLQVAGLFFLLACGLLLSLTVFFAEKSLKRTQLNTRQKGMLK